MEIVKARAEKMPYCIYQFLEMEGEGTYIFEICKWGILLEPCVIHAHIYLVVISITLHIKPLHKISTFTRLGGQIARGLYINYEI